MTLYALDSTGGIKVWSIEVLDFGDHAVIKTSYGKKGGTMIVTPKTVFEGKNIGKANETTYLEQANLEMESLIKKKRKEGYGETAEDHFEPMLAFDYFKKTKHVTFPCIMQPKYDGIRCIVKDEMKSRKGTEFTSFPHILNEVKSLGCPFALDGELYSDTLTFEEISGFVRRGEICKADVYYMVYDVICDLPQDERLVLLSELGDASSDQEHRYIKYSQARRADSVEDFDGYHEACVENGYEGIMIRNKGGFYKNGRSNDLLKYKKFQEEEFEIVGFDYGTGTEEGCVVWTCVCPGGNFNVRPEGTFDSRKIDDPKAFIGKKLTVKFFEYTSLGIPRFPVGKTIRDYE